MRRRPLLAVLTAMLPTSLAAQSGPVSAAPTRIRFAFATHGFTATLNDTPTARELATLLPLDLTIEDYSTNEKIARLPRKLSGDGEAPFTGEAAGDLCYYAPWGNLALFHAGYRWSRGLIRLGRLDAGIEPLLTRGTFPLRLTLQSPAPPPR